jgi:hypothetical protein
MFQGFRLNVAYVIMALYACFKRKCFTYFRLMLQVFYPNDVKVDLVIAYVAMNIHVCFKRMLQVFHLFQMYVVSVSSRCFKSRSRRAHVSFAAITLLLLGRCRGSPCERLRPADTSTARIRKQGRWLGPTWGLGIGAGPGWAAGAWDRRVCGMRTRGH